MPSHHRPRRQIPRRAQGDQPLGGRADRRDQLRRNPRPRASSGASGWRRTASSSATGSPPWPGTPRGIWRPGTASSASARSTTPSIRACSPSRSCWIVNHAEDRMMIVDLTFVPLLEKIADKLPTIERYVVLTDGAHMPKTTLKNAVAYEDWIARSRRRFRLEGVRREHRRRHVLHLRHHRPSQGRALFAPLQRAARLHGGAAGFQGHLLARRGAAGGAVLPRQWLVARLLHARWSAPRW